MRRCGKTINVEVFFSGHVQGVGFRYQTLHVARQFDVTGYVRNLTDGRVHLEVEGEEAEVDAFLMEIEDQMGAFIRKTERRSNLRLRDFSGFTITG